MEYAGPFVFLLGHVLQICTSNGILLPKLILHTLRKNSSSDPEKLLKFEAGGQEFAKNCWNSEVSDQFLVTKCFFNLFMEVSQIYHIRKIRIQIEKKTGI